MAKEDHLNHRPTELGVAKIEALRAKLVDIEQFLDENTEQSREISVAKTKLEEFRMWAVKGIVFQNVDGVDELPEKAAA